MLYGIIMSVFKKDICARTVAQLKTDVELSTEGVHITNYNVPTHAFS